MQILTTFSVQLMSIALIYVLVLVSIFLDLWSGVRKAKQRGEYRSSAGLRRTIDKIARYYTALLAISVIDILQMLAVYQLEQDGWKFPMLPIFSYIGAAYIMFIELRSIYESADKKTKENIKEFTELLQTICKNPKDAENTISAFKEFMDTKNNLSDEKDI